MQWQCKVVNLIIGFKIKFSELRCNTLSHLLFNNWLLTWISACHHGIDKKKCKNCANI